MGKSALCKRAGSEDEGDTGRVDIRVYAPGILKGKQEVHPIFRFFRYGVGQLRESARPRVPSARPPAVPLVALP